MADEERYYSCACGEWPGSPYGILVGWLIYRDNDLWTGAVAGWSCCHWEKRDGAAPVETWRNWPRGRKLRPSVMAQWPVMVLSLREGCGGHFLLGLLSHASMQPIVPFFLLLFFYLGFLVMYSPQRFLVMVSPFLCMWRFVFRVKEYYYVWKIKSQINLLFFLNLNIIKNQIWKKIIIIILMIMIK